MLKNIDRGLFHKIKVPRLCEMYEVSEDIVLDRPVLRIIVRKYLFDGYNADFIGNNLGISPEQTDALIKKA